MRGDLAGEKALWSPLTSLPIFGGAISHALELNSWQEQERAATLTEAEGPATEARLRLRAMSGGAFQGEDPFCSENLVV